MCCFEQILEAAPYKTVAVRAPAAYLTYLPSRQTKYAAYCWRSKNELKSEAVFTRTEMDNEGNDQFSLKYELLGKRIETEAVFT